MEETIAAQYLSYNLWIYSILLLASIVSFFVIVKVTKYVYELNLEPIFVVLLFWFIGTFFLAGTSVSKIIKIKKAPDIYLLENKDELEKFKK